VRINLDLNFEVLTVSCRVSADFISKKSIEVSCNNNPRSFKSFHIEIIDEYRDHDHICDFASLLGSVKINNPNSFVYSGYVDIPRSKEISLIIKPKIVTTDEILRSVSPKK
jgi:hypothetical protein